MKKYTKMFVLPVGVYNDMKRRSTGSTAGQEGEKKTVNVVHFSDSGQGVDLKQTLDLSGEKRGEEAGSNVAAKPVFSATATAEKAPSTPRWAGTMQGLLQRPTNQIVDATGKETVSAIGGNSAAKSSGGLAQSSPAQSLSLFNQLAPASVEKIKQVEELTERTRQVADAETDLSEKVGETIKNLSEQVGEQIREMRDEIANLTRQGGESNGQEVLEFLHRQQRAIEEIKQAQETAIDHLQQTARRFQDQQAEFGAQAKDEIAASLNNLRREIDLNLEDQLGQQLQSIAAYHRTAAKSIPSGEAKITQQQMKNFQKHVNDGVSRLEAAQEDASAKIMQEVKLNAGRAESQAERFARQLAHMREMQELQGNELGNQLGNMRAERDATALAAANAATAAAAAAAAADRQQTAQNNAKSKVKIPPNEVKKQDFKPAGKAEVKSEVSGGEKVQVSPVSKSEVKEEAKPENTATGPPGHYAAVGAAGGVQTTETDSFGRVINFPPAPRIAVRSLDDMVGELPRPPRISRPDGAAPPSSPPRLSVKQQSKIKPDAREAIDERRRDSRHADLQNRRKEEGETRLMSDLLAVERAPPVPEPSARGRKETQMKTIPSPSAPKVPAEEEEEGEEVHENWMPDDHSQDVRRKKPTYLSNTRRE